MDAMSLDKRRPTKWSTDDQWVVLKHTPIAALCGAVGRAMKRRNDHVSGRTLLGIQIEFPPAAKASHPRVWADRLGVYEYFEDPRTVMRFPTDMDVRAAARHWSEALFDAMERDMWPGYVGPLFGFDEDYALGTVVFHAWLALFRARLISVASLTDALLTGTLPSHFEQSVKKLESTTPGHPACTRLRSAAGTESCLIKWEIEMLVGLARGAIHGTRVERPSEGPPTKHDCKPPTKHDCTNLELHTKHDCSPTLPPLPQARERSDDGRAAGA